jgi:probable rRNA maturation factor
MPTDFHLTILANTGKPYVPYLRRMLRLTRALLTESRVQEFTLLIVGDKRMGELHDQFMGDPSPTDVLTFEQEHDPNRRCTAGDVVVNLNEARRRAKDHGVAVRDELLLYALHGMLHLSGHDDTTKPAFAKMHAREDQILSQLGIGPIFHALENRKSRK